MTNSKIIGAPLKRDIVYTPEPIAKAIIKHFAPSGAILDPCRGNGVFYKHLPNAEWCEIQDGRDFFLWSKRVDWIISNPPFSLVQQWLLHSFEIADNIVYLLPSNKPFNSDRFMRKIYEWGGIKTMFQLGSGRDIFDNYNVGFGFAAFYFLKDYSGPINIVFGAQNNKKICHTYTQQQQVENLQQIELDL